MVTKSEKERLAVMEEQLKQNKVEHKDLKDIVLRVEGKIDKVGNDKLDKKVFDDYTKNNREWKMWIPTAISAACVVLVTIVSFMK